MDCHAGRGSVSWHDFDGNDRLLRFLRWLKLLRWRKILKVLRVLKVLKVLKCAAIRIRHGAITFVLRVEFIGFKC